MTFAATRNPNLDMASVREAGVCETGVCETSVCETSVREAGAGLLPGDDPLVGARPDWWWTGCAPVPGECPGVGEDGRLTSLPLPDLARCTRQEVLDYFENGWALTEVLLSSLQGEEAFLRAPWHQLRHPMAFYTCHPAVVYVNKLRVAGLLAGPVDPYFEQLFETGVDEMSWDDLSKNVMEWPPLRDVVEYRRTVHGLVRELIETHPGLADGHPPVTDDDPLWALFLGFEHERIHIETSSVLLRELPLPLLRRPEAWPADHPSAAGGGSPDAPEQGRDFPDNPLVDVAGGAVLLGKPRDWPSFGWDNEYGARESRVRSFRASRHLVTNGAFHAFVVAGGYREERYWTEDGWRWRQMRNAKWPTFWISDGPAGLHRYRLRTVFDAVPMPWSWPAEVNWYEARAYCAWKAEQDGQEVPYRLITEAEHHLLREPAQRAGAPSDPVMTTSGTAMPDAHGANLNLAFGSASPVDALRPTAAGFHDVAGNVWQWTEDDFNPLPGFRVHRVYDDFSTPCFDGEHRMILGGSFASTGDEASIWSRFHFRPHFHQHAGFRLAVTGSESGGLSADCDAHRIHRETGAGSYESDTLLGQYMVLHFGADTDAMPHAGGPVEAAAFPRRVAELVTETAARVGAPTGRVLDVGCAVGGTCFELARTYGEVVGVDLSASFVAAADALRRDGRLAYRLKDEGEIALAREAVIDPSLDRSRLTFRRADACALPPDLVGFDAVVMANLLCRLPSPRAALGRLGGARGLVRPGGQLVLTTPFTWREEFTPRDAWLGGRVETDGTETRSADVLREILDDDFELLEHRDLPMVIREHARKFEYVVPLATVWRRRG